MADAFVMFDHRHLRTFRHGPNEPFAAARHAQIDILCEREQFLEKKVELRVDGTARQILKPQFSDLKSATEQDWFTEYNDYILNVRVVDGVKQAIDHINHYGSAHSDSIVTRDEARARQFLDEVDSAA